MESGLRSCSGSLGDFVKQAISLLLQGKDVGADLGVMERDAKLMRRDKPFVMANTRGGVGVKDVADFIVKAGGLAA